MHLGQSGAASCLVRIICILPAAVKGIKGFPWMQATFAGEGNKALSNGHASATGHFGNIVMNGSEVFRFAVRAVPKVMMHQAHLINNEYARACV